MPTKGMYTVIPFKGIAQRKINSINKSGIKPRGGQIIVFEKIFYTKGKLKIHIPTEMLNHIEDGTSYLLVTINSKGIKGKLQYHDEYSFLLTQLLISAEHIKKIEVHELKESVRASNLTAKLLMMTNYNGKSLTKPKRPAA
jgi:hypothetical protein